MTLAHQLADVQLAGLPDLGRTLVAEVRVVLPDRHLGRSTGALQVRDELLERLGHVLVAQVPALHPGAFDGVRWPGEPL